MIEWDARRVAEAAGATLAAAAPGGPRRAAIDSRDIEPGDLFVGLAGENFDGGAFAAQALAAGAWGVLVAPAHAPVESGPGAVLLAPDPLLALGQLALSWRRELGCQTVAITGSTGKTSTKDILAAILADKLRSFSSPRNLNTEIGLPLAVLAAPMGTEALVLELAMRGPGQIAELAAICEPDVGVIVNVGPAHLELLGSLEAVAAAKGELLEALPDDGTAVIPVAEPLLGPYLRDELHVVRFGNGGEVRLIKADRDRVVIAADGERIDLEPNFRSAHQLENLLAAVAAARALGVAPQGPLEVVFSELRGERIELGDGIVVIDDCYNANPMSMRAALEDLATSSDGRRVAVLGDMLELGGSAERFHREVGDQAGQAGVELLITVGPLAALAGEDFDGEHHHAVNAAAALSRLEELLQSGDTVLVKGSRSVGLEVIARQLGRRTPS